MDYQIALFSHISAGTLALISFWLAALFKKGSLRHRRVGQVYLLAMLGVILSGVPLAFALVERGHPIGAMFLTYLLLLVSHSCWNAWLAIRDKRDPQRYFGARYWSMTALLALAGIAIIGVGSEVGSMLLQVFGGIGLISAIGGWRAWRRASSDPLWWLREHYGAMIGNGVATHIAFIGIGLRNALPMVDPQLLQALAWFGPLSASLLAAWWLSRRYPRRQAQAQPRQGAAALG